MSVPPYLTRLAALVTVCGLAACGPGDRAAPDAAIPDTLVDSPAEAGVVEVTARDFAFEAPAEIPSGWTTIRMRNAGQQEHFLYLYRLPEEVTYERFLEEFMVPFGNVWNAYAAGEIDRSEAEARFGSELPGWFLTEVTPSGGPALTEPGVTSQATVELEPGTYVMECYVKTPDGRWHTELGMQRRLVVTDDSTGAAPPAADAELTLSNYEIATSGGLSAGERTIAVHVEENPEGFMMHDVNLFRLDGDTSVGEIVAWMDWMDIGQFRAPAPGHSLGGVEHMAAGRTGYMTVDLAPGDYAWVSEGYGARGVVREFTVR
ncbi:MAG TPA: hypothetical protein VM737_10560 [Gemmatimonadota bacterium]|nr:hypothetical protein [Gemmatimonadota bacterium]